MSLKFSTIPQKRLLQGITSASSTFYVNNILSFDGVNDVTPADLGTQHYVAFRNDTGTILELMEIDPATISSGPITIVRRGLSFYGDLTTETTDLKLDWPSNSIVMFGTDVPQIFQWLKEYIDAAAIAGAVPASTSAAGIVVEASQAEVDAGTVTKTISAVAYKLFAPLDKRRGKLINDAVTATSGSDAYAIAPSPAITAYATYQRFSFIADVANTGACTLNVNGLGAKTIKKNVSTDIDTGDILAGQVVEVEYDGTYMQLLSKSSLDKPTDVQVFTADGTWTKPTGAKVIEAITVGAGGSGGGGYTGAAAQRSGGSGGGGGAIAKKTFRASDISDTVTVTVATAPSGGAAAHNGTAGGSSSFGTYLVAYGGGAGSQASGSNLTGGGGGGTGGVGADAQTTSVLGGTPALTAGVGGTGGQGAGCATLVGGSKSAEYGGGSGGTGNPPGGDPGGAGGSSIFGAGGGAGGGGIDAGTGEYAGGAGGRHGTYTVGGGGSAGAATGAAGGAGTSRSGYGCGDGGGGGGALNPGAGGNGGAGGAPGGGGGGGGAGTSTGGAGGAGGRGEVIVITYF